MQVLVLYYTRTGNTRKLAEAVAEGVRTVPGCEAIVRTPDTVTIDEFRGSHGVVVGSPVYFGGMAAELKKVLDDFLTVRRHMEGKVGAAFATSAHPSGGKETTILAIHQALLIYGMIVMGDPLDAGGHYGVACAGAPDEATLGHARKLGARVARIAQKLFT
ncbi:MAG: Trp repressor-binding protein [Candidatus Bipolaricaulis sibiricus]|uniref:Trp repressor-binding protein n=1 Tax=Bipolaricaulis sibiricus TaxID=2501609 RepID=A0A410FUN5_BIPS1|nr:MAG: Trp repressor-binding protein [Candidatus Bipolaricaulis sibiricus]